jgi:hypothetical protein
MTRSETLERWCSAIGPWYVLFSCKEAAVKHKGERPSYAPPGSQPIACRRRCGMKTRWAVQLSSWASTGPEEMAKFKCCWCNEEFPVVRQNGRIVP